MYCGECGQLNGDGMKFCTKCGTDLVSQTPTPNRSSARTSVINDMMSGAETVLSEANPQGRLLAGQYRLLDSKPLGSGGMGEVWRAEDTQLDNAVVAIKVLPAVMASNSAAVTSLKREALIGRQLSHPNICRLYSFHSDGEIKFIVMEFVEGKTLANLLAAREDRRMNWDELEPIARSLAEALDYAHRLKYTDASGRHVCGILHRDIKPQNIMVTPEGVAKLMDFGIAREIHNTMTEVTGRTSQTPLYASPEQFRGERMTTASDLYSFAAVLYECLAGRRLVSAHGDVIYQVLHKEFESLAAQSAVVNTMLAAGLAKDPTARPAMLTDLVLPGRKQVTTEGKPPVVIPPAAVTAPAAKPSGEDALPRELTLDLGKGTKMELVLIPAGEFLMGSPNEEEESTNVEDPQRRVRISRPFYMGKYEVTQAQWQVVMGSNPSVFKGDVNLPVENVSWNDCQEFCEKLSQKVARKVRLPSEAEWEYACRAGTETAYSFGDSKDDLEEYGWYKDNSGGETSPVGLKQPNAWGLYDMHGNVWEWCQDVYHGDYEGEPEDGTAWVSGDESGRVLRGGSRNVYWWDCYSTCRGWNPPDLRSNLVGLRVVVSCSVPGTPRW